MDLMAWFFGLGDLTVDLSAGTIAIATACLLLSEHWPSVGGEEAEECIREDCQHLIAGNRQEVLSFECHLTGNEEIHKAARVFLAKKDGIQ